MKKLKEDTLVDINHELQDMIEYTLTIWDGNPEDLKHIVTESFTTGYNAANNWLSNYVLTDYLINWMEQREKLGSKSDMTIYDDVTKVAKNIMFHTSTLRQLVLENFSYEKNARDLTSFIKNNLSDSKVFPKKWKKVVDSDKSAFDYFSHFNLKEDKLFRGHNGDTAGSPGFHERINLANTFYGDTEQGRSPLYTLVSSSFAHGLTLREHNNSVELFNELQLIKQHFEQEQFNKPVFINNLLSLSDNKLFQALMIDKYGSRENREYSSQEQLDQYLLDKHSNKDIYGMVKWSMLGSDDYYHTGFTIQKIYTLEHFETQIKHNVESWFEDSDYKEIYYSDNNFSTVNKDDILSSLKFIQVSNKDFEVMQQVLGGNKQVRFGDHEDFMDYNYPSKDEMIAYNAERMKAILESIKSGDTNPIEKATKEDRENSYKKQVFTILNIKNKNNNKIK